jgi:hypothetical protein
MSVIKQAAFPTEGDKAEPIQASSGQKESSWWQPWKKGLQLASQLVLASPLGLPVKVVKVAKYLSLALGILDSFEMQEKVDPKARSEANAP